MVTELVKIEDHLLLIDGKAEVCRGHYRLLNKNIERIHEGHNYPYKGSKIIGYYPLTKEAKELNLPLLPPFEEDEIERLADEYSTSDKVHPADSYISKQSFIAGYETAQSKQFSLEDMKKALSEAFKASQEGYQITADEIIQSLSTQQLPKEFVPELESYCKCREKGFKCGSLRPETDSYCISKYLKTTTNSEGKQGLVGTYKY